MSSQMLSSSRGEGPGTTRQRFNGEQVGEVERKARAEARRQALRQAIEASQQKIEHIAHAAGLKTAGAIGNFLAGKTDSLNVGTYEPLAQVLGLSVSELIGEVLSVGAYERAVERVGGRPAHIRGMVKAGEWQKQYCWNRSEWIPIVMPNVIADFGGKSYFLRLDGPEMNQVSPDGTILEVVNLSDYERPIASGARVIVLRTNQEGYVEISAREVVHAGDGVSTCTLETRSSAPEAQGRSLPWPWPLVAGHVETTPNGDQLEVRAIVVRVTLDQV